MIVPGEIVPGVTHRFVDAGGLRMHIAEAGSGPLVLLLHGFPESWYSWRHQLTALAGAGFHAVAPDQRGYCETGPPPGPAGAGQYTILHLTGDVLALMDALGEEHAYVAGHDWGAPVAWHAALFRPDMFTAVAGLRVPPPFRGRVSTGAASLPTRWNAVGVANATMARTPLISATPNRSRPVSSSFEKPVANGTVSRNATRICTPGSSTRSSCNSP